MKSRNIAILIGGLLMSGCTIAPEDAGLLDAREKTFRATFEDETTDGTKTSLSLSSVLWSKEDSVALFPGSKYREEYVVSDGVGTTSATLFFKRKYNYTYLIHYPSLPRNVGYYPYSDNVACDYYVTGGLYSNYYVLHADIPSYQQYATNSFGPGAMPMIGLSTSVDDSNLKFKNVFGALRVTLKGEGVNVKRIELRGNNDEPLYGRLNIKCEEDSFDFSSISFSDSLGKVVTLDCGDGVLLDADEGTDFYIALPPVEFTKGFTVNIVTDSYQMEKVVSSDVVVSRSQFRALPLLEVKKKSSYTYISELDREESGVSSSSGNLVTVSGYGDSFVLQTDSLDFNSIAAKLDYHLKVFFDKSKRIETVSCGEGIFYITYTSASAADISYINYNGELSFYSDVTMPQFTSASSNWKFVLYNYDTILSLLSTLGSYGCKSVIDYASALISDVAANSAEFDYDVTQFDSSDEALVNSVLGTLESRTNVDAYVLARNCLALDICREYVLGSEFNLDFSQINIVGSSECEFIFSVSGLTIDSNLTPTASLSIAPSGSYSFVTGWTGKIRDGVQYTISDKDIAAGSYTARIEVTISELPFLGTIRNYTRDFTIDANEFNGYKIEDSYYQLYDSTFYFKVSAYQKATSGDNAGIYVREGASYTYFPASSGTDGIVPFYFTCPKSSMKTVSCSSSAGYEAHFMGEIMIGAYSLDNDTYTYYGEQRMDFSYTKAPSLTFTAVNVGDTEVNDDDYYVTHYTIDLSVDGCYWIDHVNYTLLTDDVSNGWPDQTIPYDGTIQYSGYATYVNDHDYTTYYKITLVDGSVIYSTNAIHHYYRNYESYSVITSLPGTVSSASSYSGTRTVNLNALSDGPSERVPRKRTNVFEAK